MHDELTGESRVAAERGLPVYAESLTNTGHQEQQSDFRIAHQIAESIQAIVTAAVGYQQGMIIGNFDESWDVAAG